MKYLMKKVIVFIMVVVLAISSGYGFQVNKTDRVKAANATFATLKSQYPSGSIWNGSYKNKAWQCHGFACMLGDALTGTDPYTWPKLNNLSSLKPGDIIRCSRPHSIMVTGVSGDTITYVDCNWVGKNTVKWDQTIARSNITGKFGSLICVMSYTGTVPPDPIIPNPDPVVPKPAINNVKIDSIDFRHITLSFSAYNSGLVRVVAVSKTTGQEVKQDFTSGLENVRYTFETSSMGNPGKDFYIRIYAYSTPSGGNETLHAVTYGPEIGSVKLPDKELQYNMETLPQDVVVTETSLRGWVIGENITKVTAVINSLEYECTREKRDDVGNAFPGYDSSQAGFRFNFNVFDLDNGSNTLSVRAYTSDVDYVELYNGKMEVIKLSPYYVDWSWYYFNYHNEPEIAAIGLNPEKLIEYYYTKGILKGHSPCMGFDPKWYLEKNGDIKAVGNITDMVGAYVHFVKYCLPDNEKRNLSPFLDLKYYQDNNADLAGKKADELFYHYYRWGSRLESRSNSNNTNQAKAFAKLFVANEYAAANGDVQAVTGDGKTVESAENVWSQFFAYMLPRNDKRVTSNQFDMAFYMNKYGIATTEEAFWRYINSGYANGEITKQEATKKPVTPTPTILTPAPPTPTPTIPTPAPLTPTPTIPVIICISTPPVTTPPVTETPVTEKPGETETPVTEKPTEIPVTGKPKETETPVTETPEVTKKPVTEKPEITAAPIIEETETPASTTPQTSVPKDTAKPQTTFAVPTMPPTGDGDFSEDFITKIELYSDLDKEEQLRVGDSFNLYADIEPEEFEDTELLWSSNNEKIATVDKKGNVQCVGAGKVTITVMATDGSGKSASMTFEVKKALGSDNNLSSIKVSQGKLTPAFKKTKKSYSLVLSKNMSKAVIKVKKSDSAAKVKINGKTTEKITVNLKRGQTKKVTIRVVAENGKGQTYQIKVKRKK